MGLSQYACVRERVQAKVNKEIAMPYKIGDEVWWARTEHVTEYVTCPDCSGKRFVTLILGNGDTHTIDCGNCQAGYEPSTGRVPSYSFAPVVRKITIGGVETQLKRGVEVTEYRTVSSNGGYWVIKPSEIFDTEEAARLRANELRAEEQAKEEKRMKAKHFEHRTWAWHVSYHRRNIERAKKELEYHTAKLDVAKSHVKAEKVSA